MNNNKDQLVFELDQEITDTNEETEITETLSYNSEFELDSKAKIQGSPVFLEEEIPFNSYKSFECISEWSKTRIVKENFKELGFVCPKIFRNWAEKFLIHPLLEPEYSTWIMSAEGESLLTILTQFNDSQADSFSEFYSSYIEGETLDEYWESELTSIGMELLTRLGIVRMGKHRLERAPRIWVGRRSEASSPQIRYEAFGYDALKTAKGFIEKFVGEDAKNLKWQIGYRGGLWRIHVKRSCSDIVLYIEEYEDQHY